MDIEPLVMVNSGHRHRTSLIASLSAAMLLNCGAAAWAHHSFAMYDMKKPVEVKGTVKEYRFGNPHSWIILSVKDKAGKSSDFSIETNGSFYLAKTHGWKRNSLKFGDVIMARVNPMRDGSRGGDLIRATLSDGRVLIARVASPPVPEGEKK